MADWYIYKYTGEKVVVCAPLKGRLTYRGIEFEPGDYPVICRDNGVYKVDENTLKSHYRPDPNEGREPEPMACSLFEWPRD